MTLGWDANWDAARRAIDPGGALAVVRIVAENRGQYRAMARADLAAAPVELTGKTFHLAEDKRDLPTVGDWVLVEGWDDALAGHGAAVIRERLPRRTFLVRRAAGEATAPQPLAANVDLGIVMTSANADLSVPRLDRYVALLRDGGIEPVIAISKVDLAGADDALAAARTVAPRAVAVSVVTGVGLDEVRALGGDGRTCVLLGSSGVGKSSLLNALIGTHQETRPIRADERGVHTTTRRELFVAPDGGLWIDTPGMRELAQWIDDDTDLADAFDDIAALAAGCKFRDCRHAEEPGCAVRDAVPAARLASFHKLATERQASATRQRQAQRIAQARKPRGKPGAS